MLGRRAARLRIPLADLLVDRASPSRRTCVPECSAASLPVRTSDSSTRCAYFDVDISAEDPEAHRQAHRKLADAFGVADRPEALRDAYTAYRRAGEIPADRLGDCVTAFSSALRDEVRKSVDLPVEETVEFEIVSDQPWSGFNYYLGDYRSRVRSTPDANTSAAASLSRTRPIPGHHTEHFARRSPGGGQGSRPSSGRGHPAMPDGRGAGRRCCARHRA